MTTGARHGEGEPGGRTRQPQRRHCCQQRCWAPWRSTCHTALLLLRPRSPSPPSSASPASSRSPTAPDIVHHTLQSTDSLEMGWSRKVTWVTSHHPFNLGTEVRANWKGEGREFCLEIEEDANGAGKAGQPTSSRFTLYHQ
ncbi:hypothetical protein SEVIR_3G329445v4 [Setaria viridis]